MNVFRKLACRFRALFRKRKLDAEMAEEMRAHLELQAERNLAAGMSEDEARYAAQRQFGGIDQIKELARDQSGWRCLEHLRQDVHYGVRVLGKNPRFTSFVLVTLMLGIGANTAIFSVVNSVLLQTLPVSHPEELVFLTDPDDNGFRGGLRTGKRDFLSYPEFQHLRDNNGVFSEMLAVSSSHLGADVEVPNEGQSGSRGPAIISMVSGNYFSALGVSPVLGHFFTPKEDKERGANPVAVISHAFWQNRFGGDQSVLGRIIRFNGTAYTIVGVARRDFFGETGGRSVGVWVPLSMQSAVMPGRDLLSPSANPLGNFRWLSVIARLKPDVDLVQAQANIDVVFRQFLESQLTALPPAQLAGLPQDRRQKFFDQHLALAGGSRGGSVLRKAYAKPLVVLMALVGLLLLSACANLANLMLARATRRQKEIALRVALGAKSSRIFRQLLTESLLLSGIGGALGLLLAFWGDSFLLRLVTQNDSPVHTDVRVLFFGFGVSLVVGIIFGVAPALQAWRVDLNTVLKGTDGMGGKQRSFPMSKLLVVVQVALSLPLLVIAGLFVHSFQKLASVELGYDQNHLVLLQADATGYKGAAIAQFYRDLSARIRILPGVHSVAISTNGLFAGRETSYRIAIDDYTPVPGQNMNPSFDHVSPGYFATVGIPVLRGREIGPQDSGGAQRVGLINQTMARQYFGDGNPLDRRITVNISTAPGVSTPYSFFVVGVVADAKYHTVREKPRPVYYVPLENPIGVAASGYLAAPMCIIRTSGNPLALTAALRTVVKEITPNSQPPTLTTVNQMIAGTLGLDRALTGFSGFFGALAAVLVSVGIYGIMSYGVARRTREIGIRIAIGAQHRNVLRMIVGESLFLVLCGVALGVPAAFLAGKFVTAFLFGLTPADPHVFIAAVALMFFVGAIAAFFPARTATRVDPMVALRCE